MGAGVFEAVVVGVRFGDAAEAAAYLTCDDGLECANCAVAGGEGVLCAAGGRVLCGQEALGIADGVGDLFEAGIGDGVDGTVEIVKRFTERSRPLERIRQ